MKASPRLASHVNSSAAHFSAVPLAAQTAAPLSCTRVPPRSSDWPSAAAGAGRPPTMRPSRAMARIAYSRPKKVPRKAPAMTSEGWCLQAGGEASPVFVACCSWQQGGGVAQLRIATQQAPLADYSPACWKQRSPPHLKSVMRVTPTAQAQATRPNNHSRPAAPRASQPSRSRRPMAATSAAVRRGARMLKAHTQ